MKTYLITMLILLSVIIFSTSCSLVDGDKPKFDASASKEVEYDKVRFNKIRSILDSQRDELRGIPFDKFLAILGIEECPWDENYTNEPNHSRRTYHLKGFFIDVDIEDKDGQLCTDSYFYPGLHADGLTRQERLKVQEEALHEYFKERQKALDKLRKQNKK